MKIPEHEVSGPKRDYVGYGRNVPKVAWPGAARGENFQTTSNP